MPGAVTGTRPSRNMTPTDAKANDFIRFMRLVTLPVDPAGCWEWQGTKPDGRYGRFSVKGKSRAAHRWIYEALHGPAPVGLVIRHRCDNPGCCNPMHLEIGTHSDNQRDKFDRGRGVDRRGEKHPLVRITGANVLAIRAAYATGTRQSTLAQDFGISHSHVGRIVRRQSWGHI